VWPSPSPEETGPRGEQSGKRKEGICTALGIGFLLFGIAFLNRG